MEGKKFQIRTDKKIGFVEDIRWTMNGPRWFTFTEASVNAGKCNNGHKFTETDLTTKGFFLRAGVLTFLKTSTQLQIWFDDVLEVTWVYEDNDADNSCMMRKPMTGLSLKHQVAMRTKLAPTTDMQFQP